LIAIITARGGSKGLPRKNILPFCGKPLLAHTILAAAQSRAIDQIIVSTDDAEIAAVARQYGAEVPFMRPAPLASDTASSRDVLRHALSFLAGRGENIEAFCLLQPTSPLRTADDIDQAIDLFQAKNADSVISVTPFEHPLQLAVEMAADKRIELRESTDFTRRQDMRQSWRPNGAIYIFRTEFFQQSTTYYGANSYGYLMPAERSVDIDSSIDLVVAEAIAGYLIG